MKLDIFCNVEKNKHSHDFWMEIIDHKIILKCIFNLVQAKYVRKSMHVPKHTIHTIFWLTTIL